jgi:hypothetical protein
MAFAVGVKSVPGVGIWSAACSLFLLPRGLDHCRAQG